MNTKRLLFTLICTILCTTGYTQTFDQFIQKFTPLKPGDSITDESFFSPSYSLSLKKSSTYRPWLIQQDMLSIPYAWNFNTTVRNEKFTIAHYRVDAAVALGMFAPDNFHFIAHSYDNETGETIDYIQIGIDFMDAGYVKIRGTAFPYKIEVKQVFTDCFFVEENMETVRYTITVDSSGHFQKNNPKGKLLEIIDRFVTDLPNSPEEEYLTENLFAFLGEEIPDKYLHTLMGQPVPPKDSYKGSKAEKLLNYSYTPDEFIYGKKVEYENFTLLHFLHKKQLCVSYPWKNSLMIATVDKNGMIIDRKKVGEHSLFNRLKIHAEVFPTYSLSTKTYQLKPDQVWAPRKEMKVSYTERKFTIDEHGWISETAVTKDSIVSYKEIPVDAPLRTRPIEDWFLPGFSDDFSD